MRCSDLELDLIHPNDLTCMYLACMPAREVDTRVTNQGVNTLGLAAPLDHDVRALLSKGLSFVLTPNSDTVTTIQRDAILSGVARLKRSLRLRVQFGDEQHGRPDQPPSRFRVPNPSFRPSRAGVLERGLRELDDHVSAKLQDAIASLKRWYPRLNMSRSDWSAVTKLRRMAVVVRPADKNLGVTVMSQTWYDAEVQRQVAGNPRTYQRVARVPVRKVQHELRKLIRDRHGRTASSIDRNLARYITQLCGSRPHDVQPAVPRFYLLPKLHKSPPVGRPIVSSHSWVTTHASRAVDALLQPVVRTMCTRVLRDTGHMIRVLEATPAHAATQLLTADVVSLYTNIPHDGAITAVMFWLSALRKRSAAGRPVDVWWWERLSSKVTFPQVSGFLRDLVQFIIGNNYFTTGEDVFYHQRIGFAMGTPCAVVVANMFMAWVESQKYRIPANIKSGRLLMWARFIDDIFAVWCGTQQELADFCAWLGRAYPKIALTFEVSSSAVDFLDLHVHKGPRFRASGLLDLAVHRKRLNRYLYLPWQSGHPRSQKRAFVKGELIRFARNSSDFDAYVRDVALFATALRARGYPRAFLQHAFKSVSYNQRAQYLAASQRALQQSSSAPYVLVAPTTPLSREADVGGILTLAQRVTAQAADVDADLDRTLQPTTRRWILARTLPQRLGELLRLQWPPSLVPRHTATGAHAAGTV